MPHEILSISIFEDEHPNEKNGLNAVILHTGLSEALVGEEARDIYKLERFDKTQNDTWAECYNELASTISTRFDGRESMIASATVTNDSSKLLVRISFDTMKAELLKAQNRPDGCCCLF